MYRTSGLVYQEAVFAGSIINTTLFQLLAMQKVLDDADDNRRFIVEAVRLALILWFAAVRRSFGIAPIVTAVHMAKLISLLKREKVRWGHGQMLMVKWLVLGVAILEAVEEEDLRWLQFQWSLVARRMEFDDVKKARKAMTVLWIQSAHGEGFKEKAEYYVLT